MRHRDLPGLMIVLAFAAATLTTFDRVVLTWRKRVGARFDLWGQRFTAGAAAWGTPTLLETRDTAGVVLPRMAVGPGGVAAVAWLYFAEFEIWANVLR